MSQRTTYNVKKLFGILLAVLLTALLGAAVPAAQAQIPVTDTAHIIETTIGVGQNTITAGASLTSEIQFLYQWSQSFILASLKTSLVGKLQDKIIGFSQGGAGANSTGPKFVVNWMTYLQGARNTGAQGYANNVAATPVCGPFKNSITGVVGGGAAPTPAAGPATPGSSIPALTCDFTPTQMTNFNQDFNQGGWVAYSKSLEPQNNYFGAAVIAREGQNNAIVNSQQAAQNEAVAGNGFLSAKKDGAITTPGSLIKDFTSNAQDADFKLITSATQLPDIAALVAGLTADLTKPDNSGVSGVNLSQRAKARNAARNADGTRIVMTRTQAATYCNTLFPPVYATDPVTQTRQLDPTQDDTALRASCIENATAENGNGDAAKTQLLQNVNDMLKNREAAKLGFTTTIAAQTKTLKVFDSNFGSSSDNPPTVDPKRLCTESLPGRKKDPSASPAETWPDGDGVDNPGEVPSSVTTGEIYDIHVTPHVLRACATQTLVRADQGAPVFNDLVASRNELITLRDQNLTAITALQSFIKRVRAAQPNDDNTLQALHDELATGNDELGLTDLSVLSNPVAYSCGGQLLATPGTSQSCAEYGIQSGVLSLIASYVPPVVPAIPPEPTYYICGPVIPSHPEFNQNCTDYTVERATDSIEQQSVEVDPTETPTCDPAAPPSDPNYCDPNQ